MRDMLANLKSEHEAMRPPFARVDVTAGRNGRARTGRQRPTMRDPDAPA